MWHNSADAKRSVVTAGRRIPLKGLGVRVVSGTALLAIVLAAIWVRGPMLMAFIALAAVLAAHEFYTMVRRAGYQPWYPAGVALALLLALRGYLGGDILAGNAVRSGGQAAELMALALILLLVLGRQSYIWLQATSTPRGEALAAPMPRSPHLAWADLGLTFGGALYTGGLLGYAPLLAALPDAPGKAGAVSWLLMVLLGTTACDTGAYFVGSATGRHKMIPHISPGKTWEGLVGGIAGAVLAAVVLSGLLHLSLLQAVVLGLVVCAAAVLGDLCESLLKRACGVKDSGNIIPGHGGVLDRVDSILFVLLAVYWFIQIAV